MTNRRLQRLTWLAMFVALCVVGRLFIHPWPNVQPVSALLLYGGTVLAFADISLVAVLSLVLTGFYFGLGSFVLAQIAAYMSIILLFRVVSKFLPERLRFLGQIILAGLMGYLYGFIISLVQAIFFGIPNFWVYYLQGLLFDTYHAVGNLLFYSILIPPLNRVWQRFLPKE